MVLNLEEVAEDLAADPVVVAAAVDSEEAHQVVGLEDMEVELEDTGEDQAEVVEQVVIQVFNNLSF